MNWQEVIEFFGGATAIERLGLNVLNPPICSPVANAICECAIRTMRRECLAWLIPMSEVHLRAILKEWRAHYNGSRSHIALGPRVPDPPRRAAGLPAYQTPNRVREGFVVLAKSVLGGLHHEYSVTPEIV